MFPLLIVLIFSLFQSLNADGGEFPRLPQQISVKWSDVLVPADKVDFRLTASFGTEAPYLIFCGPFKAGGNDATCEWNLNWSFRNERGYNMGSGKGDAKNILTIDDNVSCMRIKNPLQNFPRIYKDATESNGVLSINYSCKTSSFISSHIAVIIPVLLLICVVAAVTFYVGKKQGIQKYAQEKAYAGKNLNNISANPSLGSPLC